MYCSNYYKPANFALLNWKMIEPTEGVIYWHIVNFTPDMDKYKVILAFQNALDRLQVGFDKIFPVGRYISIESTDDFHKAHIRYFFMVPHTREQVYTISDGSEYTLVNNWPFSGAGDVLAHRPPHKHEIHFDESEKWTDMHKPGHIHLEAVVIHETGHCFDLGHSVESDSIMAPWYDASKLDLRHDDLQGLQKRWGPIKQSICNDFHGIDPTEKKGCLIFGL